MSQIIKGHNKKIIQQETQGTLDCSCRVKTDCLLSGDSRKESAIYKCTARSCYYEKSISWIDRGRV